MPQRVTCQISISLDGYVAGPDQSLEDPLGRGGKRLHRWAFGEPGATEADARLAAAHSEGLGAVVMGRNMFGGGHGDWDLDWRGWWGEDPPYHVPVFVLTHHERALLAMEGGTTFHFVTDGFDAALAAARAAAGDRNVGIAGGGATVRQALAAGVVEELLLHVAPVLLGSGERIFDDVGDLDLTPIEVLHSPLTTHVRYRVGA